MTLWHLFVGANLLFLDVMAVLLVHETATIRFGPRTGKIRLWRRK